MKTFQGEEKANFNSERTDLVQSYQIPFARWHDERVLPFEECIRLTID